MSKMYIIGAPDVVGPFKAVGANVLPGSTDEEVKTSIQVVYRDKSAVLCMITETAAKMAEDEIENLRSLMGPAVLLIPGHQGTSGESFKQVRQMVARAVGVDLMASISQNEIK